MACKDPERRKAYNRAYCLINRKKATVRQRIYRKANLDKVRASDRARYWADPEKARIRRSRSRKTASPTRRIRYPASPERTKERQRAYRKANAGKERARRHAYYQANREKESATGRAWRKANPDKERAKKRAYIRANRLLVRLRQRMRSILKKQTVKKSDKTIKLLGCDIQWLVAWLEIQFKPGMNWGNYGPAWEIDHIRPCADFKNLVDPAEQRLCFHWTNLQPLYPWENRQKGSKYEVA